MPDTSVKNPWRNIWINPKETIRQIVSTNPKFRLYWLYFSCMACRWPSVSPESSLLHQCDPALDNFHPHAHRRPLHRGGGSDNCELADSMDRTMDWGKANFQNIRAAFAGRGSKHL